MLFCLPLTQTHGAEAMGAVWGPAKVLECIPFFKLFYFSLTLLHKILVPCLGIRLSPNSERAES